MRPVRFRGKRFYIIEPDSSANLPEGYEGERLLAFALVVVAVVVDTHDLSQLSARRDLMPRSRLGLASSCCLRDRQY